MDPDLTRSFTVFRRVLAETESLTSAAEGAVAVLDNQPDHQAWVRACFDMLLDNMRTGMTTLPDVALPPGIPRLAGAILVNPYPPVASVERSLDAVEQLLEWTTHGEVVDPTACEFAAALGIGLEQQLPLFVVLEAMRTNAEEPLGALIDHVWNAIQRGDSMASAIRSLESRDGALADAVERGEREGTLDRELLAYAGRTR